MVSTLQRVYQRPARKRPQNRQRIPLGCGDPFEILQPFEEFGVLFLVLLAFKEKDLGKCVHSTLPGLVNIQRAIENGDRNS